MLLARREDACGLETPVQCRPSSLVHADVARSWLLAAEGVWVAVLAWMVCVAVCLLRSRRVGRCL